MVKLSHVSNLGLSLFIGALLIYLLQLMGFMPSRAYLTLVGPIFMLICLIIFALGFLVRKKSD